MSQKSNWINIALDVNARNLSTKVAGGFTGTVIGMYTTGSKKTAL